MVQLIKFLKIIDFHQVLILKHLKKKVYKNILNNKLVNKLLFKKIKGKCY